MFSASSIRFHLLLSTAVAASVALPCAAVAQNLPQNPSAGNITSSGDGKTMTVGLTAPRTVINWDSFDIAPTYTVDFKGPSTVQAVLNRVVGENTDPPTISNIDGTLKSDSWIEVFLINPAGIIFGDGASVNVGSLVASTLDIDDDDFLSSGAPDSDQPLDPNLYYFFGSNLDSEDVVTTGITVEDGAQVNTSSGPLTFLGAFVHIDEGGSVAGATDVGFVAGNEIKVPADPGSRIDFFIRRSTPREDAITIGGAVSGGRVTAFMETPSDAVDAMDALLLISETGSITATKEIGGNITLAIGARTNANAITNSPGGIQNDGTLNATGFVLLGGEVTTTNPPVTYVPRFTENNGTITAGTNAEMQAQEDITNTGTITAFSNVILKAGGNILDTSDSLSGSIAGADVSLSAGGSVTVGTITARDDIAILAGGSVFAESLTSGATVGANGPVDFEGEADSLLDGVDLTGHDVDIDGSAIVAHTIRALGTGSDIRLRAPVTARRDDLDFAAGGDIIIEGPATGVDVAMHAGGKITTGDISARDDIALRAGGTVDVGTLESGVTIGEDGPVDQAGSADALLDQTLTGHDLYVQAGDVSLDQVTANGTNSDLNVLTTSGGLSIIDGSAGGTITLTKQGETGILSADALSAGTGVTLRSDTDIEAGTVDTAAGDLDFAAARDVTVDSSLEAVDVAIDAGGTITTGDISARDDIALRAGGTLDVGTLASGVTVGQQGPIDQAGSADALLDETLTGHDLFVQASEVSLDQVTANGTNSDLIVRATSGDLSVTNGSAGGTITLTKDGSTGILGAATLTAGTGVTLRSTTDIEVGTVKTTSGDLDFAAAGDVTVDSSLEATDVAIDAGGMITTGDISARDDIALRAGGALDIGTLTSGVSIGGSGPLDTAGAADTLLGETLTGHDLFVQASEVSLDQVTANGPDSDLTVRATSGGLSVTNGSAGGLITLTKEGTSGILSAGTLSAGTGATLTSATDIDANAVQTASGDLALSAGRDVTVHNSLAADDVAIDAGRNISTQNISARDDIAIRAGGTLDTGTLASGVTIGGTGPVDTAGAADTLLNESLAGNDLSVEAGTVNLASATATGTGSDLIVRATSGDLNIASGQAGGTVTLVKEGSSGTLSAGTLTAGTGASLTSSTGIDADNVQSASGDLDFDAVQGVTLGTALAQSGNVKIVADDLDILGGITGAQVSITNRSGGNAVTVLGDASAAGAFTLTETELNRINAPIVNIDSLDQNLLVGNVAFDNEIGSTRINLLGTARVDVVGEIDASGVNRTLQIGGTTGAASPTDPATLASIIRIAPMSSGGGRIILGGGSLDLRGAKIGVGLDDGFLSPLGLIAGGSPVSTAIVQEDWIGNFNSTLYGIPGGYADPVVIRAGSITVTYTDYALFQNTAGKGLPNGVNADNLFIVSSGDDGNGFELFGSIDQVGGVGAAFLVKPTTVSLGNSRINGCLILTGGGCGGPPGVTPRDPFNPPVPPPGDNGGDGDLFGTVGDQFAQQDLVSTDEDQAFSFDSLVGTNNEGLLGVMGVDDLTVQPCAPDDKRDTCQVEEKPNAQ